MGTRQSRKARDKSLVEELQNFGKSFETFVKDVEEEKNRNEKVLEELLKEKRQLEEKRNNSSVLRLPLNTRTGIASSKASYSGSGSIVGAGVGLMSQSALSERPSQTEPSRTETPDGTETPDRTPTDRTPTPDQTETPV